MRSWHRSAPLVVSATLLLLVTALLGLLVPADAAFTAQTTSANSSWTAGTWGCDSPGTVAVIANSDTYVDQDAPSTNFGADSDLFVISDAGKNRRTLVRFPLPEIPPGCALTAATLRLFDTGGETGRTIDTYRAAVPWTENGATWNNQPAAAGEAVAAPSSGSGGWLEWDVAAHVQALYSGQNNGFLLRDRVEDSTNKREQKYASREGSSNERPQLRLSFG